MHISFELLTFKYPSHSFPGYFPDASWGQQWQLWSVELVNYNFLSWAKQIFFRISLLEIHTVYVYEL
jgi:hypothetical protein